MEFDVKVRGNGEPYVHGSPRDGSLREHGITIFTRVECLPLDVTWSHSHIWLRHGTRTSGPVPFSAHRGESVPSFQGLNRPRAEESEAFALSQTTSKLSSPLSILSFCSQILEMKSCWCVLEQS